MTMRLNVRGESHGVGCLAVLLSFAVVGSGCGSDGKDPHAPDSGLADAARTDGGGGTDDGGNADGGGSGDDGGSDDGGVDCDPSPSAPEDETGPLDSGTVPGELVSYATLHSLGFEWDIEGDSNHDATVSVRYRKADACRFEQGMHLIRNDYAWVWGDDGADEPINNFAGSLMFLTPGTTYEVVLELSDPDGGQATRVLELATRPIPRKADGGRTLHVVPGTGGGEGTSSDPFEGIAAANEEAEPGDVMLLHGGSYSGTARLSASGEPGNHVVWQPAADETPVVGSLEVTGDHIWIDGLSFVTDGEEKAIHVPWARTKPDPEDIVITNNDIRGYLHSVFILLGSGAEDWIVTDNTIVGSFPEGVSQGPHSLTGEGVELGQTPGHVVAYNRISQVADGVSSGRRNCDIYGNDISDVADDLVEPDYGFSNVRIWGNRLHNASSYAISFQPQKLGPWYIIRNQVAGAGYGLFKWRTQDRLVFINNTFAGGNSRAQYFMKSVLRNNLFIGGDPIWRGRDTSAGRETSNSPVQWRPDWNTDVDYDGFDWGGGDSSQAFVWFDDAEVEGDKVRYPDIESFASDVGIEEHGVRVHRDETFTDYFIPSGDSLVPSEMLTLQPGSNAVDSGGVLPNLADFYEGSAPDLGAFETGASVPHFGPRSGAVLDEHELYWAKH